MKAQKNVRLSEATLEKLRFLSQRYGTETTAIEIAINNLHKEEGEKTEMTFNERILVQTLQRAEERIVKLDQMLSECEKKLNISYGRIPTDSDLAEIRSQIRSMKETGRVL